MRPIDADEMLARIRYYEDWKCDPISEVISAVSDVRRMVQGAPALALDDLRPKGRWEVIEETSSGWKQHRCSVCKSEAIFEYTYSDDYDEGIDGEWEYIGQREDGIIEHLTDFCPSCGADMRGGG